MCKNHATFSPDADSGFQSLSTLTNDDQNYQKLTIWPLPSLQTPMLPPMPVRVPTVLRTTSQFHETEQPTSSPPEKWNKVSDFTSKGKAKYKLSDPDSSPRNLEVKDTTIKHAETKIPKSKIYQERISFTSVRFNILLSETSSSPTSSYMTTPRFALLEIPS